MVIALVRRSESSEPEDLHPSRFSELTRRRFSLALNHLRTFPIGTLKRADAVVWLVQAIDAGDLVLALIEQTRELLEKHPQQAAMIIRDKLPMLRQLANDLATADEALRDIAEPGWREQVKGV
jgi:hypothetical protein